MLSEDKVKGDNSDKNMEWKLFSTGDNICSFWF